MSMGFSRQKYSSGVPCPSPGDLPDLGIEPVSPVAPVLQADIFTAEPLNTDVYNNERKICDPSLATVNILVCSILIFFFPMAIWDHILNVVLYHDF